MMGSINDGKVEPDDLRTWAFRVAHRHQYRLVEDPHERFAKALLFSCRPVSDEKRRLWERARKEVDPVYWHHESNESIIAQSRDRIAEIEAMTGQSLVRAWERQPECIVRPRSRTPEARFSADEPGHEARMLAHMERVQAGKAIWNQEPIDAIERMHQAV